MSLYDSIKKSVAVKPSVKRDEVGTMFRGSFAPVAGHHHSFFMDVGHMEKKAQRCDGRPSNPLRE